VLLVALVSPTTESSRTSSSASIMLLVACGPNTGWAC
jgi:hypothetical protein